MSEIVATEKPNIDEFYKFTMYANSPSQDGKRPRLAWTIRDSSPRITVYTNDKNDMDIPNKKFGIISAPMNPETFLAFLELFNKTINGANDNKYKIECWTSYRDKEGKMQDKILLSELWFGKDANGICWVSLIAANRPKIRFNFFISDYHRIFKHDGNPLSESEASVLQASVMVKALESIYLSKMNTIKEKDNSRRDYDNNPKPKQNYSGVNDVTEDIPF